MSTLVKKMVWIVEEVDDRTLLVTVPEGFKLKLKVKVAAEDLRTQMGFDPVPIVTKLMKFIPLEEITKAMKNIYFAALLWLMYSFYTLTTPALSLA
jgi:hypothetical protein